MKLTEKSPLWRWHEVTEWLYLQKMIDDDEIVDNAKFIEHINIALLERSNDARTHCQKLMDMLS